MSFSSTVQTSLIAETANSSKYSHMQPKPPPNIIKGGSHAYRIPQLPSPQEQRKWALQHMAGAFRVFARKGYTEGTIGHVSLRDPIDPNTFWINPMGKHFALMKVCDLVHVDQDGNILPTGNQAPIKLAGFLMHSAIHKARPDVNAACHFHTTYGKAWSCFGQPLDMINQDACIFYNHHAVYSQFNGAVLNQQESGNIVKALGNDGKAIILQNHGLLTVGSTIDEAAYLFTLMEKCCQIQLLAQSAQSVPLHNTIKIIGDKEARYCEEIHGGAETLYTEFQPDLELEYYLNDDFMN
ncbi:Class II Aldolase and Adducin N-terminal domain family protein [Candida parapsilosis]|uniref:Aldolase_II domain-containing protein n=2 Tax=Candida parapsilosis TaxID=5480 RepID=G8B504_CANPC|nr:uncharacterized protein CPAR2_601160 [Candida parapsilosis]KAF6043641.1 Class II Aldolase and Adducin N-terminal domain family protein [Candida parapsilosis]KAF6043862.1 Class II Aldolase and Adducin N-terminal domain family protein [Candida parapsilosis]KAF6045518.1 Class II Aldolase and Adducin N-terminal domain family protein [Candida parapsilosis]KAF6060305.1 Class II Aldolase and Adducin N-terminal domain family protein [Candida parapsilosis]KAI5905578.1 meiotic cell cycle [Candida par